MKDSINCAHGYGCFCRNCEHRVVNEYGESICKQGVLVPQLITNFSFCSVGTPKQEEKKLEKKIETVEELLLAFRNRLITTDANAVSAKIELKNGHDFFVSMERDVKDLKFYGIEKHNAPPGALRARMINDSPDAHYAISVDDFRIAMIGEVKSIGNIHVWNF